MLAPAMLAAAAPAMAADGTPTFTKHVAPIFYKSCIECNRATMFAPMSLTSYDDARPWLRSIKQRVTARTMPPWGSDMLEHLGVRTVDDPYGDETLLAIPAAQIDFAVIHVARADELGYVEMPEAPDLVHDYDLLIARAARHTIVCAEAIGRPADPARVALVGKEVAQVVHTPNGAWPTGLHPLYRPDVTHVREDYLTAAASAETFDEYLHRHVMSTP